MPAITKDPHAQLAGVSFLELCLTCLNSQAQENIVPYGNEFEVAKQSILNGHVKDGLGQMALLLERIDATKEPNFWSLSISFADYLHEEELCRRPMAVPRLR